MSGNEDGKRARIPSCGHEPCSMQEEGRAMTKARPNVWWRNRRIASKSRGWFRRSDGPIDQPTITSDFSHPRNLFSSFLHVWLSKSNKRETREGERERENRVWTQSGDPTDSRSGRTELMETGRHCTVISLWTATWGMPYAISTEVSIINSNHHITCCIHYNSS